MRFDRCVRHAWNKITDYAQKTPHTKKFWFDLKEEVDRKVRLIKLDEVQQEWDDEHGR